MKQGTVVKGGEEQALPPPPPRPTGEERGCSWVHGAEPHASPAKPT